MMEILCIVGEYDDCAFLFGVKPFDLKIHPKRFPEFVEKLTENVWTNNPYLVDWFPSERVIVCNGHKWKRLSDHPDYEKWENHNIDPGEFWSLVGEEWVK